MPDRRACIALGLGVVVAAGTARAHAQSAFGFDELMTVLARRRSGEAKFTEQRFVAGLDQTLTYSGTLSFTAPDKLSRRTLTPRVESFEVSGNLLTLQRGERVRRITLDSVPELAAMVEALRGTLSGDGSVLKRYFAPTVEGRSARWTLTLVPVDTRLLGAVRQLRIDGFQADVRQVELLLADGDRSLTLIEPAAQGSARP